MQYLLELLPLVVFFISYKIGGIFIAVIALAGATIFEIIVSILRKKPLSKLALVNSGLILFFSGLTILFQDSTFIKIKRTFLHSGIALFLLLDLFFIQKIFVKVAYAKLLEKIAIPIKESVNWKSLQLMTAFFFLLLALSNEIIWRNFSENIWINYKIFVSPIVTLAFFLYQIRLVKV